MKKISVIVPVYKVEAVLKKCLDSIITQTYENLEIILVDDGSPDSSGEICDEYSKRDSRVKAIHKKNAGVAAARNSGLKVATGEYCIFVDSDDYIEPIMYQSMIQIAEEYDCDVVMCDCVKEHKDEQQIYTHDIRAAYYNRTQIEKEYFPHLLMMENIEYPPTISNWLCLFKRVLIEEEKIYYEEGIRYSEDLLFGAEMLYHANSFYYMKGKYFYHYWMNPDSATHTFVSDKWKDYKKLHKRIKEIFSECQIYDLSHQIDLVLLFFVYNTVGDIISTSLLSKKEKIDKCKRILLENEVQEMFERIHILKLQIPIKLKILTGIYKYRLGINALILKKNK